MNIWHFIMGNVYTVYKMLPYWGTNLRRKYWSWFGWLVVFVFYSLLTQFRWFRAWSFNLATLFIGKPARQFTSTLCPFCHQYCPSWISGMERMVIDLFSWPNHNAIPFAGLEDHWTRDRPHIWRTRIRSNYSARPLFMAANPEKIYLVSIMSFRWWTLPQFVALVLILYMSHLMRLWYFLSSVNSFVKRACAAILWG